MYTPEKAISKKREKNQQQRKEKEKEGKKEKKTRKKKKWKNIVFIFSKTVISRSTEQKKSFGTSLIICDVIKQNESELANTDFKIKANKVV